jgi:hypothetical protein
VLSRHILSVDRHKMGEDVMKKGKKLSEDTHGSPTLFDAGGA